MSPLTAHNRNKPWLLVVLIAAGCSDNGEGVGDAGTGDAILHDAGVVNLAPGGAGSAKLGVSLTAGKVRAGRVTDKAQLLPGIKVEGRVGDYKIYNSKVAFIVGDQRPGSGLGYYGGEVLDARRESKAGAAGRSLLGETILGAITRGVRARTVGVIKDGSDGKEAMVRVIGDLAPVPLLEDYIPGMGSGAPVQAAIEYSLVPGAEALQIRLRFFNERKDKKTDIPMTLLVLTAGDGLQFFADKAGFDSGSVLGKQQYLAMVGSDVSYALVGAGGAQITSVILRNGIWILTLGSVEVPAAGEKDLRLKLVVAGGDPESVRRAVRREQGSAALPVLSGTVRDMQGAALAGARVHVRASAAAGGKYVTMARADKAGAYGVALAPGDYLLQVIANGHAPGAEVPVTVGAAKASKDLTTGGSATISYSVVDGKGKASPAKLTFAAKAHKPLPATYGEPVYVGGAARIVYNVTGKGTVKLAPGEYTITASRGFEYEIDTRKVTLVHGQTTKLDFKLVHSVDTTGYMSGDFHVHAMWSYDASDMYELKVAAMVAEGLEVPVCSEHDHIGDFNPTIAKMGLQAFIQSIIGEEVTTGKWGHFNAFPVTADLTKPNAGAVGWYGKTPGKLFGDIRAAWPKAILQINHPRSSSFGYFAKVGYDPAAGSFTVPSAWSKSFDAVEVFNASGWDANEAGAVKDWFSMLNRGLIHTVTGNSDSHAVHTHEVGYPRNYVKLSTDSPAKLDPVEFRAAVKGQRVVVSGGAFITVTVGGKSLGQTADAQKGKVTLAVKVQAPTWVDLDRLMVILGGKVVKTVTLDSTTADPKKPAVRYEGKIELLPAADSWVVVAATGKKKLSPVVNDRQPFAVTNPVYLDVDGNGVYDAPKSF